MSALIVLILILIFALFQYLKGTFARSLAMIFMLVLAVIVAFSFFETVAQFILNETSDSTRKPIANYTQPLSFLLLFILSFAIFQTVCIFLLKKDVELGPIAEKTGRLVFGAISGLIFAGVIINVVNLSSISKAFLYERFNPSNPNPENPSAKAFMDADGFVAGLFGNFSKGSLSGNKSFTLIHPAFIDETYLNFISENEEIDILSSKSAITVNNKAAAWLAPDKLVDSQGSAITAKTGHTLAVARVGIKRNGSPFTLSQLRLVCKKKNENKSFSGKGVNTYPIGYITGSNRVQIKKLSETIKIEQSEFKEGKKQFDFVFNIPNNYVPVLVAFKQNNAEAITKFHDSEQAAQQEQ